MDFPKDFLHRLRKKECDEVYILLAHDVSQKFKHYVFLLKNVKFEDGRFYTFYGEVKKIIASFILYFSSTMDEVVKLADTYSNVIDKENLLRLLERTAIVHHENQVEFGKSFLPVKTPLEKEAYEEIEKDYNAYTNKLFDLKTVIEKLKKQPEIDDFAKRHFSISVRKTNELFDMVHVYLGMMLTDYLKQIRSSLDEILRRLVYNFNKIQEESEEKINILLYQLYDKNKECIMLARREADNPVDMAEIRRSMEGLKSKIETSEANDSIARLQTEIDYWKSRIEYLNEISENLTKLKAEKENVAESEKEYNKLKCNELPGCKARCWADMDINMAERQKELTQMIIRESKALVTFFALRGNDRIFYRDDLGMFYLDEYNHKVYNFDNSLGTYHINCEGDFVEIPDYEYYYDKHGRYFKDDKGEKVYQCAPCTSHHKLGDMDLLTKVTKDCGHSEKGNKCKMEITDPSIKEILPGFDPMDITRTLDTETVRYLWDSFGSVLPMALHDVGKERPKNPIHLLAHKLLYHKYKRTVDETQQKKKEAKEYRASIYQKRKEEAAVASKKWKSKQVKPRKPEESDDAETWAVYNAQVAQQMFITSLNYFNN